MLAKLKEGGFCDPKVRADPPTCTPTYITYLHTYIPTHLHTYPFAHSTTIIWLNLPTYLPTYLPPTYLPACLPTCPKDLAMLDCDDLADLGIKQKLSRSVRQDKPLPDNYWPTG